MTLEVPDTLAAQSGCSAEELLFQLVIGLWSQGKLTLGQAGAAVGLSRPAMIDAIGERGFCTPYDEEDAVKGLETIRRLWPETNS